MADEKVYTQEVIQETEFPGETQLVDTTSSGSSSGVYSQKVTSEKTFPTRKIATELIGSALNTKSRKILGKFEFTKSGAIQVGDYQDAISGDIRISPDGIVARNKSGIETVAIDGDTGDAVFRGVLQSGTLVSGLVVVGDNRIIIDGESKQIIVNDGEFDRVLIGYQKDGF
jgi:hypothetical protein